MNRFTAAAVAVILAGAIARPASGAETAPGDPSIQLNYGSILFYKGLRVLRTGDTENGKALFKEVETHLLEAIRLAAQDQDPVRRQLTQSQAAFLLGEVSLFVGRDPVAAKLFYEQALAAYPEHDGAREKLKGLDAQQKPKP